MINQFKINPKVIESVANFILVDSYVTLNKDAQFHYSLCAENGLTLKSGTLVLTEEEYNNWGKDDNYILNLIAQKEDIVIL